MLGFKSFQSACSTFSGIEAMHMIHKPAFVLHKIVLLRD